MSLPTNEPDAGWRSRLCLRPVSAAVSAAHRSPGEVSRVADTSRPARQLATLCEQILQGRRPVSDLRGFSDEAGYTQFAAMRGSLRSFPAPPRLRLCRASLDSSGALDVVVMVHHGQEASAASMRMCWQARQGWRLTSCRLLR